MSVASTRSFASRRSNRLALIVLITAIFFSVTQCGDDSTAPPAPVPTSITLNPTSVTLDAIDATQQLSATVLDQNSQPISGAAVTYSSDNGSVASVSSTGLITAVGNGSAQITATSGNASSNAAVTVAQVVTQLAKTAGDAQTGTVGAALAAALQVQANDRLGNGVAGQSITFAVALGGGSLSATTGTTDASGRASTNWTLGTTSGTNHQVDATHANVSTPASFTATANADVPASIAQVSGNAQTGPSATPLPDSVVVNVTDQFANGVPGQSVTYSITAGGGSVSPSPGTTDSNGRAAAEWTVGSGLGANSLDVTVATLTPLTFTATSVLGPPTNASAQAGDNQNATVGSAVAVAPTVRVTDAGGNPISGLAVTFAVASGGGSITGGTPTTDANGEAAVGSWTLGTTSGTNTLDATPMGLSAVTFTATGDPGPPATVVDTAGNNQTATAGLAVAIAPAVLVRDVFGNPVPGVPVTFAVASGGGSVTGANPITDAFGLATVGSWILGPAPGPNTLTATVAGPPPVTFNATGLAGPANIAINAGNSQSATVGTAVPIAPEVLVTDALMNPVPAVTVTFAVASGGGSVTLPMPATNAAGLAAVGSWTLGTTAGANTLTATVSGLTPVTFTATGTAGMAATIAISAGNNQTGLVGFALNVDPAVLVEDMAGNPVSGETVSFAVTSGGGSVTGSPATTDANGIATLDSWVVGATPGTNTVNATVAALTPVTFTATGAAAAYDIDLRPLAGTMLTGTQQVAFDSAEAFWERIIFGDLTDIPLNVGAGTCGANSPAVNETVDDVLILVEFVAIDGAGGVLGLAGPCFIRTANSLTVMGQMMFDTADTTSLRVSGNLENTILHEIGHVVGVGSLWTLLPNTTNPFLVNPSRPSSPGVDTHFNGPEAISAFNSIGGTGYTGGNRVPVENTAVAGQADGHWRETELDTELMTPLLNAGVANPLSVVTIGSMLDLGYQANLAAADALMLMFPFSLAGARGRALELKNDIRSGPIYVVDFSGRVVGVYHR